MKFGDPSQMYPRREIVVRMRLKKGVQSDRIDCRGERRGVTRVRSGVNCGYSCEVVLGGSRVSLPQVI